MSKRNATGLADPKPLLRCAIYTRKSTEDGLEQEYNSLDAQRDAGEAYIRSQQHEGWICLPDSYDDGGFTGANMDRPGLKRLLQDIDAGRVDCVVVYKVDRLSRSLLDFARIMEAFDKRQVAFVSVTQAFNTGSSMGRLILNVLLSFAQFEREMISERTRDKIAAARRKGKWAGGMPVLGYNVIDTKLVVDPTEADRVREIFQLYLDHESLMAVSEELNRRGWCTKQWTTRDGRAYGGRQFDKTKLHYLLTNVVYIGQLRYKTEIHIGEHQGIIDPAVFDRVQAMLKRNAKRVGSVARNKYNALLRGLLRCTACDLPMAHTHTKRENRLYRYYICQNAQKHGRQSCPSSSLPAGEIERFVVDQIKALGRDSGVIRDTLAHVRAESLQAAKRLVDERAALERQIRAQVANQGKLALAGEYQADRLAQSHEQIQAAQQRLVAIGAELTSLDMATIDEAEMVEALRQFDDVWGSLTARERARVIRLLIEQIGYDARHEKLSITYHPVGIRAFSEKYAKKPEVSNGNH